MAHSTEVPVLAATTTVTSKPSPKKVAASIPLLPASSSTLVHRKADASGSIVVQKAPKAAAAVPTTTSVKLDPTVIADREIAGTEFTWSETDEPHVTRRRAILAAHPEITQLFGQEPLTFPIVVAIALTQIFMAYFIRDLHWTVVILLSYVVGGTLNHSLQLAVHELSHQLCFSNNLGNKWLAIAANLVTGFPSSVSFQKYHMDHHQFQGHDAVDTDIPTVLECSVFQGPLMKLLWIVMQPVFYALRPAIVKPKPYGKWEIINVVCQLSFNYVIISTLGMKSFAYLIAGTLLGLGLHPTAGHFIAEHYEFVSGQETYSYYGSANFFNFNVGYHNEHHDFPKIPWSRLPLVTKMAPEFYLTLPHYTSYCAVLLAYIMDERVGPFARVKRAGKQASQVAENALKVSTFKKFQGHLFITIAAGWFVVCIGYALYSL